MFMAGGVIVMFMPMASGVLKAFFSRTADAGVGKENTLVKERRGKGAINSAGTLPGNSISSFFSELAVKVKLTLSKDREEEGTSMGMLGELDRRAGAAGWGDAFAGVNTARILYPDKDGVMSSTAGCQVMCCTLPRSS